MSWRPLGSLGAPVSLCPFDSMGWNIIVILSWVSGFTLIPLEARVALRAV